MKKGQVRDEATGVCYTPLTEKRIAEIAEARYAAFRHHLGQHDKEHILQELREGISGEPLEKALGDRAVKKRNREVYRLTSLDEVRAYTAAMELFPHEPDLDPQQPLCKWYEDELTRRKWQWSYTRWAAERPADNPETEERGYKVILVKGWPDDTHSDETFFSLILPKALDAALKWAEGEDRRREA